MSTAEAANVRVSRQQEKVWQVEHRLCLALGRSRLWRGADRNRQWRRSGGSEAEVAWAVKKLDEAWQCLVVVAVEAAESRRDQLTAVAAGEAVEVSVLIDVENCFGDRVNAIATDEHGNNAG
eukprot:TRINITY_DN47387_c0_g1_i1.p2 TRINITY_DN47387_c0_g1~~TRINITY_DN47387_c0_g1_i1.p2  ORF type:complete len:132 (-),score=21.52 TRINITY_DN47387_c0_g1_i1:28-393(-)